MQESASFWTDIKNLEEQLAKSPDSFCFARLSDVYYKVGLVDDALHVARQGVMVHPGYLSGQRTLAQAFYAKGLNAEALDALKMITVALPEDVPSQKMLGRLLTEAGNHAAARLAFRTALEFAPDDVECRIELESLERSAGEAGYSDESYEDNENILEDIEILEDLEIIEEDQQESEWQFQGMDAQAGSHHDPLSTVTLAELYVSQGFIHKALEIYRAIQADNPAELLAAERIAGLEALGLRSVETDIESDEFYEAEVEEVPALSIPEGAYFLETGSGVLTAPDTINAPESKPVGVDVYPAESGSSVVHLMGTADNTLSAFDAWLENIRRIKSCR